MSEISKSKCDQCGLETEDCYKEIGWIQMEGLTSMTVSKGREKDGQVKTDFMKFIFEESLDFCCFEDFILFFKEKMKIKKKKVDKEGEK